MIIVSTILTSRCIITRVLLHVCASHLTRCWIMPRWPAFIFNKSWSWFAANMFVLHKNLLELCISCVCVYRTYIHTFAQGSSSNVSCCIDVARQTDVQMTRFTKYVMS